MKSTLTKMFLQRKWLFSLSLVLTVGFAPFLLNQPGLQEAEPMGKYLNGAFPPTLESNMGIGVESPFPNSTFANVLNIVPEPLTTRIHVVEQAGFFYLVDLEDQYGTPNFYFNIIERVWNGADSGVMGMAFHPEFNQEGSPNKNYLYLYYITEKDSVQFARLSRFTRPDGTLTPDKGSELVYFEQRLGPALHRGGGLLFGKDGFLYLAIGDMGYLDEAQNISTKLMGGILRIDVDEKGGDISHPIRRTLQSIGEGFSGNYYIPNDNPFLDEGGNIMEEYYALGSRNPHRMTMDSETGKIYIGNVGSNGENGQPVFEEINLLEKGANYGWPFREGVNDRPDLMNRPDDIIGNLTDPIHTYKKEAGNTWVCGGYVYRGTKTPELYGKYIFGDGGSKRIWSLELEGDYEVEEIYTAKSEYWTFGQDLNGEVYIGTWPQMVSLIETEVDEDEKDELEGIFYLQSIESGKVIEVTNSHGYLGANVAQGTNANGDHQQWTIEKYSDGSYGISAIHSTYYLDIDSFKTTPGANIHQWEFTGNDNQKWFFEEVGDYYRIKSKLSETFLSVADSSHADGANIQLGGSTEPAPNNQLWELIPVPGKEIPDSNKKVPELLSETGAFSDLQNLVPAPGVLAYTVNAALWSDSARKYRFVAIPNDGTFDTEDEQVKFVEKGESEYPEGTVFLKHFSVTIDENDREQVRKLETRVTVKGREGYYALTYRWLADGSDAELLEDSFQEDIAIKQNDGTTRQLTWYYPSRAECFVCHTEASSRVLGPQVYQLNGDYLYKQTGVTANQLITWDYIDVFDQPLDVDNISKYIATKSVKDESAPLEARVRSYLHANCASCHMPEGGTRGTFDARFYVPTDQSGIVDGEVIESLGIEGAKVVVPGDTAKSILYQRIKEANTAIAMPPLGKGLVDKAAVDMVAEWILSLGPNKPVALPQGRGLAATYFTQPDFKEYIYSVVDSTLDFDWRNNNSSRSFIDDPFSVRWEGEIEAIYDGSFTFYVESADKVRLWVDNQLLISNWRDHELEEDSATISLEAGKRVSIKMEYAEKVGQALARLSWAGPQTKKSIIPKAHLFPTQITLPEGSYVLSSRISEKLVTIDNQNLGNEGNVIQWENDSSGIFLWNFREVGNQTYVLENKATGLVAEALGQGDYLGTNVVQSSYKEQASQHWTFEPVGDGYMYVKNVFNGLYLDLEAFSNDNGGNIHLWEKLEALNQQWLLTMIQPGDFEVITSIDEEGLVGEASLSVFPNPVSSQLNLRLENVNRANSFKVSLLNLQGQLVWDQVIQRLSHSIDVSHLTPGLYIVRIINLEGGEFVERVIIE